MGVKQNKHKYRVKSLYNITQVAVQRIWEQQAGLCAICYEDIESPPHRNTHIDHDHATGNVRGLLCPKCNMGIGMFMDNPILMFSAGEYLARKGGRIIRCRT